MKQPYSRSDEILNAFVDDELDAEECQALLNEQVDDPQLANTICELRVLKDMVRVARPNVDALDINVSVPKRYSFTRWFAAASVVMMMFSLLTISFWNSNSETTLTQSESRSYTNVMELIQAQQAKQELKMVLHIKMPGQMAASRLFEQLEQVLEYSAAQHRRLQVQVIATGKGIGLLQQGKSPYPDKIQYISSHYDTVEFVACQRSMLGQVARQKSAIQILPEVLIAHSGPELIKRRQKQGWATIVI